jgi:glycosyltransferase involved in cell wall biosynthesis
MTKRVDLILLGGSESDYPWTMGRVWPVTASTEALHGAVLHLQQHLCGAKAFLFWDRELGRPNPDIIQKVLTCPGDVWHAGLGLGLHGLPGLIDFVAPTWMLSHDPPADTEATSWRISLRCCLVRPEVFRQMGGVHPEFISLAGAGLEMGHRYATRGVLTRHIPWLLPQRLSCRVPEIPFEDEFRFIYYRFGGRWSKWALLRGVLTRYISPAMAFKAWREIACRPRPAIPAPFVHNGPSISPELGNPRVSVLIPTLKRYPYLRKLLAQLSHQTIKPQEILLIDQTPPETRDLNLKLDFHDLPLQIIYLDQAGQCSARNVGLARAAGEFILFLDDDDEVSPDLIEAHVRNLKRFQADVSSGVAKVVGGDPLPENFTYLRLSDVFPTGNTLIDRRILESSGLFDLAYNKGTGEDHDMGMRIYLGGGYMILNPGISVLHHQAPAGGLRAHKARTITYASSRQSLIQRHLPSKTEIYLAKRYCTPRQVRESLWLRTLGTFSLRGPWWRRGLKIIIGFWLLPHTWRQIKSREREAERMLQAYPQIPAVSGSGPKLSWENHSDRKLFLSSQ